MASDQRLKQAVSLIIKAGYQLDAEALAFLKTVTGREEAEEALKEALEDLAALPEKTLFLKKDVLEAYVMQRLEASEPSADMPAEDLGFVFKPYAEEIEGAVEVLYDPAEQVFSEGKIEDYLDLFKDRFSKIEKILRERMDVKDAISVGEALKAPLKAKVKTIGLVAEKIERKRVVLVRLEDSGAELAAIAPSASNKSLFEKTRKLLIDQMVCVEATKLKDDLLVVNDFISPDIPDRRANTADEQVYAALTSDLHVGSKKFLGDAFNRFIDWLKGREGSDYQREIAGRVKYLVIAGDVVDGIGVYPRQERELAIDDIYEQYSLAAKLLREIPAYIEIIIIPGNHDATRHALPQPAILEKYAKPLYDLKNVTMLGDPTRVSLHKVELLTFHGSSLDDILAVVPDATYQNLKEDVSTAMRYFLKTRHLAPIFGSKTPIAPAPVDGLVINPPPDILHMGHVHVMGFETYRGTLLVNSGTWQDQTEYQSKMGLIPTPGIVPIVDLKSLKVIPINFLS